MLVVAVPGSGKSMALAAWAESDGRQVAWLTVDEQDNDLGTLVTYLATALERIGAVIEPIRDGLRSKKGGAVAAANQLAGSFAELAVPAVVILDDVDQLHNEACLDAIGLLADRVPAGSQLVLATRKKLESRLAQHFAESLTLGSADFKLSDSEATALLQGIGVELSESDLHIVNTRCDGWAAGLYLVGLALRGGSKKVLDADVLGADRFVSDYFRFEVLDRLEREERDFLLDASVLTRLCAGLCDSMRQRDDSNALIASLTAANAFLAPVDDGEWFELHPLFRDSLRSELFQLAPDRVATLLERATDWHDARGDVEPTIDYAIAAGAGDRAAALCLRFALPLYWQGHYATIERWLAALDDGELLARQPALAVLGAAILAREAEPERAERWARLALRNRSDTALPDGSRLVAWTVLLRALLCRDGVAKMRIDAEVAVGMFGEGSTLSGSALTLLGFAELLNGNDERATQILRSSIERSSRLGASVSGSMAFSALSLLAARRGDVSAAGDLADSARRIAETAHLDDYVTTACAYVASARAATLRGWRVAAQESVEHADRLASRLTSTLAWLAALVRVELAHVHLALANPGRARELLDELDEIAADGRDLGILADRIAELRHDLESGRSAGDGWTAGLTPAELRLLPLLASHLSFRDIAERLGISRNTVKTQAIAVYRKLSVASRSEAVDRARELGLVRRDAAQRG